MGIHIEDVEEHLRALLKQESASDYRVDDYLLSGSRQFYHTFTRSQSMMSVESDDAGSEFETDGNADTANSGASWSLTTQGRWQIGQWFYRMIADFKFPREFAMIAMNYLDRVISNLETPPKSKEEVQLIALTCFYLAVKLFQAGPVLSTEQMAMLSGGMYTAQQVSATEKRILFALGWSLHPPCAADFVRPFFMVIMQKTGFPLDLSHYDVLELALGMLHTGNLDYFFIAHQLPPSHMAAAALLNAMHAILPASFTIPSVQEFIQQIKRDAKCTLHEGQINLCRQRYWALLDSTGMSRQCPPAAVSYPTTPPPPKRAKNYDLLTPRTPTSPNGVIELNKEETIQQLQAPF